jgi:hypothetical protein
VVRVHAAPLLDELRTRWTVATENRAGTDGSLERILETLHGIQVADAALLEGVGKLREFTAGELSHVRRQRHDQAGYARATPTGTHLDLRR